MEINDTELEVTEVVDGSNVIRRGLFGLENIEVLVFLVGAMSSAGLLFLLNLPFSKVIVLTITPIPFLLSVLYIACFLHGKPPHSAGDFAEGVTARNQYNPFSKAYTRMPDGMFTKHMLVWDGLTNGVWACGMELEVPALDYSKNRTKNHFVHRLSAFLNLLAKDGLRVQLYWSVNSNYTAELREYQLDTDSLTDSLEEGPCKRYRTLRYEQYHNLSTTRMLRRERVIVFVSRPLREEEKISWNKSLKAYDEASMAVLADLEATAQQMFQRLRTVLEPAGISCRELTDNDLLAILRLHFNPSSSLAPLLFGLKKEDELSIREQVIFSDITHCEGGAAFMLDNQYYNVIALKAPLPKLLHFGIINQLTKLVGILDYEIVVNIVPRNVKKVLQEEEKALSILENQRTQKNAPASLDYAYRQRYAMVGELFSERSVPLDVQYFIFIHGISPDELMIKTTSIKGALSRIGTGYYTLNNAMAAINGFFQGTPGWLYGGRSGHHFRTLDKYLAPLLPISSTYTGSLFKAEAIYQGEQDNLVGIKQFAKAVLKDSDPQHALLFGKTGSGKSVLTADLIMQTHGFYEYTVIIDYGLSYKALAEKLGTSPIFLGPSANITINYFDTQGLPLTGEHLSLVSTILRVMSDELASDGMIMRYLKPFYLSAAKRWYTEHEKDENLIDELTATALLSDKYLRERICEDEVEAYKKACAEWENHPFLPTELSDFLFQHKDLVFYQCFSKMLPEDFDTHSNFVNFLRSKPLEDEEDLRTLQEVTDALELWQRNGKNGRLFDGITNLDMNSKFQYFELSGVPANDKNFKFAAGALIQLVSMRKIERMDRALKKRLIIDEANSFFEIPQGAKVIESALTKYRKHRCSVLISFQQYEMLNQSEIKESITSNIHQYLLMGQTDRNDVDQLSRALGLSEQIGEAILNFETPANLPVNNRYSSFAQIVKTRGMLSGIGRNAMTPAELDMIGSQ